MKKEKRYPIGTVSKATGVNPVTLRAWQRRYGLIKPSRTEKGHRLYSEQDIETIKQILSLLSKGVNVGQVKPHLNDKPIQTISPTQPSSQPLIERVIEAVETLNVESIDHVLGEMLALYPIEIIADRLLPEIESRLDDRWWTAPTAKLEQSMFDMALKGRLMFQYMKHRQDKKSARFIVGNHPCDIHCKQMLMSANLLASFGLHVTLIPDLSDLSIFKNAPKSLAESHLLLFCPNNPAVLNSVDHFAKQRRGNVYIAVMPSGAKTILQHAVLLEDRFEQRIMQLNPLLATKS